MPEAPDYPGMPRWVKISGAVAVILLLLIAVVVATGAGGPHGPGRHLQSGEAAGDPTPSGMAGHPTDGSPVHPLAEDARR